MVYVISDGSAYVKIGMADDLYKRIQTLQTGNPHRIICLLYIRTDKCQYDDAQLEHALHMRYARHRLYKDDGGTTEWFDLQVYFDLLKKTEDEIDALVPQRERMYRKMNGIPEVTQLADIAEAANNILKKHDEVSAKTGCANNNKHAICGKLIDILEKERSWYLTPNDIGEIANELQIVEWHFLVWLADIGAEVRISKRTRRYSKLIIIDSLNDAEKREKLLEKLEK